ncbi:hypothetical protein NOR_00866 [Metarhizium rileyi]|uniref:Uncharacterized protein n=1 Tax=Metarhizium rileyi (strain RCEF 4871) TaxID=1649241 RepID=A0A167JKE8_METRR|nr:hypothetical protein NOR_00866 [Metarhizium rileyi RCEF 4871]TWU75776.1 hypothetical protein ED733_003329 [Metarhizium rileyi]
MIPGDIPHNALAYKSTSISRDPWNAGHSALVEPYGNDGFRNGFYSASSTMNPSSSFAQNTAIPRSANGYNARSDAMPSASPGYALRAPAMASSSMGPAFGDYGSPGRAASWDAQERYSPTGSIEAIVASPSLSDYSAENGMGVTSPQQKSRQNGKRGSQRRPSNRDEFDGPHQFLQRPPQEVIDMQERELPHLPTNLHVQEQDTVLNQVNDRLSQCAFDFVAKYQFPIPLTQDMRPVERPQDREWTEWVYLLKRLATKRRIPARVLYNGQIKQFVTILENSLEMRHAAKHQSRPLKDDRNILQLISAGIQVAKILKDSSAMEYLDHLYVETESRIRERTKPRFRS